METPSPARPYIADFLRTDAHLVVELDGGQHADQRAYDERRTAWLKAEGLDVLRFWNSDVFESIEGVCEMILNACGGVAPHPTSPRERGEEG